MVGAAFDRCRLEFRSRKIRVILAIALGVGLWLVPAVAARGGLHRPPPRHPSSKKAAHVLHVRPHGHPKHGRAGGVAAARGPSSGAAALPGSSVATSSSPASAAAAQSRATPALASAPPSAASGASGTGSGASAPDPVPPIEEQVFALINQVRQAHGLPALLADDKLTQAAQIQAGAMAQLDEMSHELSGMPQPTFTSRLQFVGYNYEWAAENLAYGSPDAPAVVALWMGSPPHEANILSPYPIATGVAVAYDRSGIPYYCQVFGEPR